MHSIKFSIKKPFNQSKQSHKKSFSLLYATIIVLFFLNILVKLCLQNVFLIETFVNKLQMYGQTCLEDHLY